MIFQHFSTTSSGSALADRSQQLRSLDLCCILLILELRFHLRLLLVLHLFMPDHRLLINILENINKNRISSWILHLS
ncbi:GSCOCG00011096001-RA-CDS [Cotesia congregata]|nr:GSCOCG00011096001-RA-CDS [Cotesia congregata]